MDDAEHAAYDVENESDDDDIAPWVMYVPEILLHPNSNGLAAFYPNSDGLQPRSEGLQPRSEGLQPEDHSQAIFVDRTIYKPGSPWSDDF